MNRKIFCHKQFKRMLLSAILMMLVMTLNYTMDMILAARLFGDNAMAGLNLIKPLVSIAAFFAMMISTGTSYLYSFEIGAFRNEKANKLVGQGVILIVILAIVLGVIAFFDEGIFFSFFPNLGATEAFAREYYSVLFLIVALNTVYALVQTMVYADGGGKNCVIAIILQLTVNLFASIILGLKLGIVGIAFGTVIGYLAAMAVFAKWIFIDSQTLKPICYFSLSDTVKVLKYSYVHASLYLHIGLGNMILNAFFLQTFGDKYFPVLSVVTSVLSLAVFLDGIGQAAEPLINIYLGEKNFDGVAKVMDIAIKTALILGVAVIPIIFMFSINIASFFGITDPTLLTEAEEALRTIAFSMPCISLLYLFATYYQICGHVRIALAVSICKDLAFYVGLPIIFSLAMGIRGIWFGITAVSIVSCLMFALFLRIRYPKSFPLLLPPSDIVSRDSRLTLEKVMALRDWGEREFIKRGFDAKIALKVALLIEEIGMSIVDNNPNNQPLAELTLFFDEQPKIIIRDNGMHFDLTDEAVTSFRSFFVYSLLDAGKIANNYLTTQNYNRHVFCMA